MNGLAVLGDSQSAPRAPVTLQQTWGFNIARVLGIPYFDKTVGGNTSAQALARVDDALATGCEWLGIMIGANDLYLDPNGTYPQPPWSAPQPPHNGITPDQYAGNVATMLNKAISAGRKAFVVSPWALWSTPSMNQGAFYVNALAAKMAYYSSIPLVNGWGIEFDVTDCIGQQMMWTIFETDWQHPDAGGHYLIFERVRTALGIK
jgi:lysophospholipase L1-like esterase